MKRVCGLCFDEGKEVVLTWNKEKGSLRYCPVHDREVPVMMVE